VVADPDFYGALKDALAGSGIEATAGEDALVEAAERPADWVMAAISGSIGLNLRSPQSNAAPRGACQQRVSRLRRRHFHAARGGRGATCCRR